MALAEKTHRGLEGRIKAGKSGGGRSYGYRVARDNDGSPMVGDLAIDEAEAAIIHRIFEEYRRGRSPLHIAGALNADGIPAPGHKRKNGGSGHWKQNTINGNRARGTGILNNELYVGRPIWNRLEYRKDPISRMRVSRLRPESEWMLHDLPELRIVSDDLWNDAKRRQDAQVPKRQARWTGDPNRRSGSQTLRRKKYLLSGLLECGICGGKMTIAGTGKRRRYYCANHKEKGAAVCAGMSGLLQRDAEALVLHGLREQLMQPVEFEKFRVSFIAHFNAENNENARDHNHRVAELGQLRARQESLVRLIADGRTQEGFFLGLTKVEQDIRILTARIEANRPHPIEIPENMPALYRTHIEDVVRTLSEEEVAGRAADALREMIDRLVVRYEPALATHTVEIFGNLAAMLAAADTKNAAAYNAAACSRMSLPDPARISSFPPWPRRKSLPRLPRMRSGRLVQLIVSARLVPLKVAMMKVSHSTGRAAFGGRAGGWMCRALRRMDGGAPLRPE